jgi:CBS domain containing-hemolysin-like protein
MVLLVLSVLAVLVASGLSSGAEVALLAVSYGRVLSAVEEGRRGARTLKSLKDNLARPIMAIVIWNNVANIVGSIAVGALAAQHFDSTGVGIFSAVLTLLVIVFAEIIPKTVGERWALQIALAIAPVLRGLSVALLPIIWVIEIVVRPFQREGPVSTSEAEIDALTTLGEQAGVIEKDEGEMIHRVFRLNDVLAGAVMTPLGRVDSIGGAQTLGELRPFIAESTHTRIPVFGAEPNQVLGSVTLRVLLQALADGNEGTTAAELVQPVDFVPDAMSCDDLLVHFRATRRHLALVVDSNGTVLGLVTMEDVIEQLVGEIVDETDKEERKVLRLANGDLLVDATVETMELAATLDIKLPAGRLGELVVQNEGRIPVQGESLQLEGLSMVVEKATPSHLVQLRVKKST